MKNPDLVNMREFSKIIGINYSYLSQLCLNILDKENVTSSSPRFYHGLQIPYPVGRNFFATGKKWKRDEVLKFKQELDEHDAKSLE
jgi:hypothetical protein